MDIARFLARHPPFDDLERDAVESLARSVLIEFFPHGSTILEEGGAAAQHLYVVRSGEVEFLDDGTVVDLAGEGEVFGALSLITGGSPTASVRAHEDTLCYLIPAESASKVLGTRAGVSIIATAVRRSRARQPGGSLPGELSRVRVGTLVRRDPVTFDPDGTVEEAARRMADQRISSLLIPTRSGLGILTDRDLRTRVLAARRSPRTPVADVMTFPARTVHVDATAGEVLLQMLEGGFHHLPVVDGGGRLVGVVTDTDLLGMTRESPFALKSAIERSADEDSAIEAARGLPLTIAALADTELDPVHIGHVVGVSVDALTRKLIGLGTGRLGEPPVPWAWLALGSEARFEQALATDQDHGLVYQADRPASADVQRFFSELAEGVTSGLERAGLPRCEGQAMAVNPSLRVPLDRWIEQLHSWIDDPGLEGSVLTSIVFDYRRVDGPLDAEPRLDEVLRSAHTLSPHFVRHLAHRALDLTPPTGFFRDFVVESRGDRAGRLDIKHRGILIISNLARLWAIMGGRAEKRTIDRLQAAVESGVIGEEARRGLEEAFRLLWHVRVQHQAAQVRRAEHPDDFVDPAALGPIERRGLKEAFRIIGREQRAVRVDLNVR